MEGELVEHLVAHDVADKKVASCAKPDAEV